VRRILTIAIRAVKRNLPLLAGELTASESPGNPFDKTKPLAWNQRAAFSGSSFPRTLAPPRSVAHRTLTTLRDKFIKIGAKVIRHARYVMFQMAEVAVPRALFATILEKIQRLEPLRSDAE
jgi:hypothetical protein